MTQECPRHPGQYAPYACLQCARESPQPGDALKTAIVRESMATAVIGLAAIAAILAITDGTAKILAPGVIIAMTMAAANCVLGWLYSEVHQDPPTAWRTLTEAAFWRTAALAVALAAVI